MKPKKSPLCHRALRRMAGLVFFLVFRVLGAGGRLPKARRGRFFFFAILLLRSQPKKRIAFRSRVAGPNAVYIHEEGGTAGRPTGPCFLACLAVTHKVTHIEQPKSHKRKKKDTNHVRYPTKDSARGAQCTHRTTEPN